MWRNLPFSVLPGDVDANSLTFESGMAGTWAGKEASHRGEPTRRARVIAKVPDAIFIRADGIIVSKSMHTKGRVQRPSRPAARSNTIRGLQDADIIL